MGKIKIITDCTSDLTKSLYQQMEIDVMPLYVTIGGKTYEDGVDITTEELYKKVEEFGELPKSSAVNPNIFIERFQKYINDGYQVLFMGIGSKLSATFQSARIAASEFEEGTVRIVDSNNLSSGIGLLLLKAAKFRNQGDDLETIAKKVESIVPMVRTQFAINTLDYLHKGGRCSGTARIFGTLLSIKPIIRVIDGKLEVAKKPRGKFSLALKTLLDYIEHDKNNIDTDAVMVTHSLAKDDAKYLINQIKAMVNVDQVYETYASGVISTHCGPRTIGILYIVRQP